MSPITLSASFILIGLTIYIFDWVRRTFRTIVAEEEREWGDWPALHEEMQATGSKIATGGKGLTEATRRVTHSHSRTSCIALRKRGQ